MMEQQITLKYEYLDAEPHVITGPGSIHNGVLYDQFIENFSQYNDNRVKHSQVLDGIFNYIRETDTPPELHESYVVESINDINDKKYILAIAVAYSPFEWTDTKAKTSIFELLTPLAITDLQNEKALLLIDQSIEGYHQTWLWAWFHRKCRQYNINPKTIIYMTGDQESTDKYDAWCVQNKVSSKLKIIPSIALSTYIRNTYDRNKLAIKFDELLEYKKNNSSTIHLYDCLNLRPRPQRILAFLHLLNADLLQYGNVSMSEQSEWRPYMDLNNATLISHKLPTNIISKLNSTNISLLNHYSNLGEIKNYHRYYERILDDVYKNSWLSIVTESSYFRYENSIFVSEKTFKPIACMQPFIIVGSRGTLKYLRKLGYKTFHPFIDESYDDLDDQHRLPAIMEELKRIQLLEDKVSWYKSMQEIVEHNHKLFMLINKTKSIEHEELIKYYFEYSKENNV